MQLISLFSITNAIRLLYGRNPLIWDDALAQRAQDWADNLKNKPSSSAYHDFECQNLFMGINAPHVPAEKSVCHWLENDGHRATLLSDEITSVGCGVARGQHTVVICNYAPTPSTVEHEIKSICPHILPYRSL